MGRDLEKAIGPAGITDLLHNLGSVVRAQIDDRNIFELRDFGKTGSL